MNILLIAIIIFTISLLVIELCAYAFRLFLHPDRAAVRRRLRQNIIDEGVNKEEDILKRSVLSDVPFFNRILHLIPGIQRLQLLMNQANAQYTLGFFILTSMFFGLLGYLLMVYLMGSTWQSVILAIGTAFLPMINLRSKKKKRMAKFEKQLPDALGLVARALRAGHAFSSGMKLASQEFGDPLGAEFEKAQDEINFGLSVADALKNMTRRVDCPDLKFFVVSVILQRETGGNLAEIIESLAHLIRERFKFRGKVRVLTAEGRLSAGILLILPFVLFAGLFLMNPEYVSPLITDPIGIVLLEVSAILMVTGVIFIKRIINVDV